MKRSTRRSILVALSAVLVFSSMSAMAAGPRTNPVVPSDVARVSDRLIVKYKANNLPRGLSVAQIREQLMQPLTAQALGQLQTAAGVALTERRTIFNGAHVLRIAGRPDRRAMSNALAGIRRLSGIEYVEEDRILTAQAVPDDSYYTNGLGGLTGLWGLRPATTVASPAPGATGSYGADFETAWDSVTGTGVVVAVIDTGITPHVDIVGPGETVAAGAGSNLVSSGYDFISDCRIRGTCAATTSSDGSEYRAPSADATDLGDFLSSTDCSDVNSYFYGCTPENSSWHGTHVAGTIAALGNNAIGVIGGAYNARILPVRVLGKGGGYVSDIAEGIMWAADAHSSIANPNKARVINISLGGSGACSSTEQNAIDAAIAAGTVVVVAAGNSDADVANFSPANCNNVITVASVARDGSRAGYSNYSSPATNTTNPTNVMLAAQGADMGSYLDSFDPGILSTLNSGTTAPVMTGGSTYVYYQGTSMATPQVAAAVALMLDKNSTLTPAQVKTILSAPSSLTTFPSFSQPSAWVPVAWDCTTSRNCGAGILNANLAVQNSAATALTAAATTDFGAASINVSASRTITFTNASAGDITLGAVAVTGNEAAFFHLGSDTCSAATVAAGGTCAVTLSYVPTASGVHAATLTVEDTTSSTRTFVALTGAAGSRLSTTTPSVTASTVTLGQTTTVDLRYRNPNWIDLPVGAIVLSQPSIMAPSNDNCSNTTLAAGASCLVTVTITPAVAGVYSGTVSLSLVGGGTPAVATISGTANPPPPPSSGGGGCSIMPFGADPDVSLLLALLAVGAYWSRRRLLRGRSAD